MTGKTAPLFHAMTAQCDGLIASAEELAPVAFAGYAHFTAMQVREGKVRGLDLHLQRLREASLRMFGHALADADITSQLRAALALNNAGDFSLIATVYGSAGEFTAAQDKALLHLLVRTSAPANGPLGPLRLHVVDFERMLPEVKHVAELAKTWLLREAVAQGFDDAAFLDSKGRLSEATIWNLVWWDGHSVVWPRAAMLRGTTMSIVMRQLERMGVGQQHMDITMDVLPTMKGAVVMNSWTPAVAVHSFAGIDMPAAADFVALLHQAYSLEPLQAI